MMKPRIPTRIMLADDDQDYPRLVQEAFKELGIPNEVRTVENGEELLDYLLRRGKYQDPKDSPRPGLIFLDLNMPKKNGFQALQEIRSNPNVRQIPVIMLTISNFQSDIQHSYTLGANSFVTKPFEFDDLVKALRHFQQYWFETVQLPTS